MAKPTTYIKDEVTGTIYTAVDTTRKDSMLPDGEVSLVYSRVTFPATAVINIEISVDGKVQSLFSGEVVAEKDKYGMVEVRTMTRGDVPPESTPKDPSIEEVL